MAKVSLEGWDGIKRPEDLGIEALHDKREGHKGTEADGLAVEPQGAAQVQRVLPYRNTESVITL